MSVVERSTLEVESGDCGIAVSLYAPTDSPRGVIQILHGLAEHGGRYHRFAEAAVARGHVVVVHDHRGHGPNAGSRLGQFGDREGWDLVTGDVAAVNRAAHAKWPDLPLTLFGHSMGSFIAQAFAFRHPDALAKLVLSGSNRANLSEVKVARWLAAFVGFFRGRHTPGELLDRLSFASFNDAFKPNRTAFDWLSRDEAEVDRYVADSLCGFVASNGLWHDLLGGLLEIGADDALDGLDRDMPVLIFGGGVDPVGGARGLSTLTERYRAAGMQAVSLEIYPDGRHEMLNEINRDEVTRDVLDWIESD